MVSITDIFLKLFLLESAGNYWREPMGCPGCWVSIFSWWDKCNSLNWKWVLLGLAYVQLTVSPPSQAFSPTPWEPLPHNSKWRLTWYWRSGPWNAPCSHTWSLELYCCASAHGQVNNSTAPAVLWLGLTPELLVTSLPTWLLMELGLPLGCLFTAALLHWCFPMSTVPLCHWPVLFPEIVPFLLLLS